MTDSTRFGRIFLLWAAGLGAAAQYGKISVIYDRLPDIYPDAGATLGFVVSVVGFVGIVFGVVAGLLVSRVGYKRALIWALWGGAGVSALEALLPALPLMLGLRMLEGVSHLVIVVAAPTLIAQYSAAPHRGFTLTLWSTFFGVSFTVLVWAGLPMVDALGLESLFLAHAVWMAGCAVVLGALLPALPRMPGAPLSLLGVLRDHVVIYRSPVLSAPGVGWFFYTFCFLALLTLLPPFLDPGLRVFVLGAMPLVSIAVSMTAGVVLLRLLSAVQVVVAGFSALLLCLIWLWWIPGDAVACFAVAAALGLVQGASFAAVPQLNESAVDQARANGAMAQMGNIGNTLGTPALAGIVFVAGYNGLMISILGMTGAGLAAHVYLAWQRR